MDHKNKDEYFESCRQRYPSRNRMGRSAMINEVSDNAGLESQAYDQGTSWESFHGLTAQKRGSKPSYGEKGSKSLSRFGNEVSTQPCVVQKVLGYSLRALEWITAPPREFEEERRGRKTGRESN